MKRWVASACADVRVHPFATATCRAARQGGSWVGEGYHNVGGCHVLQQLSRAHSRARPSLAHLHLPHCVAHHVRLYPQATQPFFGTVNQAFDRNTSLVWLIALIFNIKLICFRSCQECEHYHVAALLEIYFESSMYLWVRSTISHSTGNVHRRSNLITIL